jgi:drug efflux transport system permease protein
MSYRRTKAVFIKELHHITRDARSLSMALAMPVMMLLLYGYALSLDVDHIQSVIYDQDGTEASRGLMRAFHGSRFFDIAGFATSYEKIEQEIDAGRILVGIVIPRDFGKDLRGGRGSQVQILVDGSDSNTASIAMGYAESIVQAYSADIRFDLQNRRAGRRPAPLVDARMRIWYNSSLESKNYVVPGLIAVILMIIAGQLTSLTIAREWDLGTMEQVLSTPLRPTEIVLGKMLAYFLVGLIDAAISLVVGVTIFDVPFRGSIVVLGVSTSVFLFGALFWGIFVSAATRTQVAAYQLGILTSFLPGFLLSGFVFAIDTMPKACQAISVVVPARYFVTILKGVFLKGLGWNVMGAELGFLMLYATIVFLLTVRKMNQKVA